VLPQPLTPASCDLRDFKYIPLDVAQFRDSELAADETPEVCWAAMLVQAASWHQLPAASLPDDDNWIAKVANYRLRGKTDRAWKRVREGVLHGWVKCADGRLYHPELAKKARGAWNTKLKQRHKTECARLAKLNLPRPAFDEWVKQGCPFGCDGEKLSPQQEIQQEIQQEFQQEFHMDIQGEGEGEVKGEVEQKQNQKQPPYTPQAKNVTDNALEGHSPSSADAAERHAVLLDEIIKPPDPHPPDGEPPPDPQASLLPVPPGAKPARDQRIVETIVDAYHHHLPHCQHVSALPPKRRRRILNADKMARTLCKQQGLSYHPEDYWDDYFACCEPDPWLNGTASNPNNPHWKQNIEVLLDEKRFAQIMDNALWQMKKAA